MIVYLDLVIISMIISDYAMLKTIALIFKEKINKLRFFFAIIFCVISLLLFIFPLKKMLLFRYFVGIVVVIIAYPFKNYKDLIIKIITFYLLNIAFIGTIIVFKIDNIYMLGIALLYVLVSKIIESYQNIIINENILTYKVKIENYKLKGYLDTGNTTYYKGLPVVFIKDIYQSSQLFTKKGVMNLKGINSLSMVDVYEGPPLYVNNSSQIVYYVFNSMIDYDIILNRDCKEEKNAKNNY